MHVVGDIELLHNPWDGLAEKFIRIAIEYDVGTVFQACFHQIGEEADVVGDCLLLAEMTADGLNVLIGIDKHGREEHSFISGCISSDVNDRREVFQETGNERVENARD